MTTKPKSCIKHPDKTPLVLLRKEYLEITGNHCAAKLLAIFEFWTNKLSSIGDALGKTAREWIYKSLACLQDELMGEHGIHAIRRGILILEELGFISKRHNPHIKYDRTWQYKLEVEKVQEALNLLICQDEQMEDEVLPIPTEEIEPSKTQISTDNNIEFNIVPPKLKTKKREEVFEKTEEKNAEEIKVIKQIANFFNIGYQPAENTFRQWCAEWNICPSSREWLEEKLTLIGLNTSVLT
ncbi:MAG: hypothetical protein RLZZ86_328 [Cyanobacteriota bacterium]|jgi:hypothetical protein